MGLLDNFLHLFGAGDTNWLGNPSTVMIAMIVMIIWKDAGFYMIFYLAGLQNLPRDVYEAAEIEGAKPFQMFRHITFPLLMPTTLFVMIVAITNSFKNVDHLYIMTKGDLIMPAICCSIISMKRHLQIGILAKRPF